MKVSRADSHRAVKILELELGVHLKTYRQSLLSKFICEHAEELQCNLNGYLQKLEAEAEIRDVLFKKLMIHASWFFRDRLIFEWLAQVAIPSVLTRKRSRNSRELRIWSAGCGRGEETYSLAMIIKEYLDLHHKECKPFILGTDVEPEALTVAKEGLYPLERLSRVTVDELQRYFVPTVNDYYKVTDDVKSSVNFSIDDLLNPSTASPADSIFGGFDVIFCRNLLLYYTGKHQCTIIEKLHRALSPKGFLVLGWQEQIPRQLKQDFEAVPALHGVFQRN